MSTVHVFCTSCKIGSPREPHELAGNSVVCTACGRPLNRQTINSALREHEMRDRSRVSPSLEPPTTAAPRPKIDRKPAALEYVAI
jgi:hypothetical protein